MTGGARAGGGSKWGLLGLVVSWVLAAAAAAQSCPMGAFAPLDSWFVAQNGTIGVLPVNGGAGLQLDRNGDGLINEFDRVFITPEPLAPPYLASATLRLSPTRQFLYAVGGRAVGTCQDTSIRFYRLPADPADPMELVHEACVPNVQRTEIFYDYQLRSLGPFGQGSGRRIAAILHEPFVGDLTLSLFDLERPGPSGRVDISGLRRGVGDIRIAPGSQALYIQHDVLSFDPAGTDYTLVSLCTASFGQQINPDGGFPLQNVSGGPLDATTFAGTNGRTNVVFSQGGSTFATLTVPDCCAISPPPGFAALSLTVTGAPATLRPGSNATFTLRVANLGTAEATNVVVQAAVPFSSTFVSAGSGGTQTGDNVRWTLPALPAGQPPLSLSFTVRGECTAGGTFSLRPFCFAEASNAQRVNAQVNPGPTLEYPNTDLLTSVAAAVPDVAPPLRAADTMTLSITLTNPSAADHIGVRFAQPIANFGQHLELAQVISATRGTASQPTPTTLSWQGDIPAGQSATIVVRLRLAACLPVGVSAVAAQGFFQVVNTCGNTVFSGSFLGPVFPIVRDLQTDLGLTATQVGVIGPVSREHQAVRLGTALPLVLSVSNSGATTMIDVRARLTIPVGLQIGATPLVAPVPPGVTFDAATRTVRFAGDLAPGASISVRVDAVASVAVPRVETVLESGTGTCVSNRSRLVLVPVPAVPTGPTLYGLDRVDGVWVMQLGVDTAPRPFFGAILEAPGGFDYVAGGPMWIAGAACVRFDPATLDLLMLERTAIDAPQGFIRLDAAVDVATNDVLVAGTVRSGFHAALVRADPSGSSDRDLVLDQTSLAVLTSVTRTATGGVAVVSMPSRVDNGNSSRGILLPDIAPPPGPAVDYSLVPTIGVSPMSYGFVPPGTLRGTYPVAIAPRDTQIGTPGANGELWTVLCTQWVNGSVFSFTNATSVYALAITNPATGTITPVIDLLAGDVSVGFFQPPVVPAYPTPLTPLSLSVWGGGSGNVGTSIATAPGDGVFVASRTALWRVDNALTAPSAVLVAPLGLSVGGGTLDLVAVNISAGPPLLCLADVAGGGPTGLMPDGTVDGADFVAFINSFAIGDAAIDPLADIAGSGPTGTQPDGTIDGTDFIAFINAFGAGC